MSMQYFSCSSRTIMDSTKKCVGTRYVDHVFLHEVGYAGHETSTHYFSSSGGTSTYLIKKCARTCYADLVFLHQV
jgi:hypothetical protein